jgi:hypothetical protein
MSDEEDKFYSDRICLLIGRELLEILEEIYWEHTQLIPPGGQPWPRVEPRTIRKREEKQLNLHRSETIVMLRLLWDVFRESHDRNIRDSAERLRKQLPSEETKNKKENKQKKKQKKLKVQSHDSLKVQPITDVIEYYQEIVKLLAAQIDKLQSSRTQ